MSDLKTYLKKVKNAIFNNLSPDEAFRYRPLAQRLKKKLKAGDRVIELGSGDVGISPYLKNIHITGVDKEFLNARPGRLEKIIYDGEHIPFPDNYFNYLINVDCLEHIEPEKRPALIREMLRVSRTGIFLVFPSGLAAQALDQELDDLFFRHHNYHDIYLEEHLRQGLPEENAIYDYLNSAATQENKIISLRGRRLMNVKIRKLYLAPRFSGQLSGSIIYFLFALFIPFAPLFNFGPCYWRLIELEIINQP